jgi:hypothetical protein
MQIKENRPDAARSGYSVSCKPFSRIGNSIIIGTNRGFLPEKDSACISNIDAVPGIR